jgi:hypothetical protein
MLLDDAAALRAQLANHEALKEARKQSQVYRSRAQQFAPLAQGLSTARSDWEGLRDAGVRIDAPEPKPGLRARASEILERFQADRSSLAAADDALRFQFVTAVRNAAEDFAACTSDAWGAHVADHADFPSDDVLSALAAIPSYAAPVQRIREAAADVRRLLERPPAVAQVATALAQLEAAGKKKDQALAAMQGDDLPAEVLAFLRKTGQGGAALSEFTDAVRKWLTDRNLMSAFRIVPSRT